MGRTLLLLALTCTLGGCANLSVHKASGRPHGDDHVKGFRYYLPRPYVVVTEPILVSEEVGLFVSQSRDVNPALGSTEDAIRHAGEKGELARVNPRSHAVEPVSPEEWETLKKGLLEKQEVIQAMCRRPASAPPVNVNLEVANTPGTGADLRSLIGGAASDTLRASIEDSSAATVSAEDVNADDVTPDPKATVDLKGKIKVFFLPDFEEQYAVQPVNVMAKSDYQLHFVDGWQLAAVSGDFDATTVALKLIGVIDSAIGAAKKLALARLSAAGGGSGRDMVGPAVQLDRKHELFQRVARTYIAPGIYRINKPWEMQGQPAGAGLLVQIGLRTVTVEEWQPAAAATRTATPTSQCCPKAP